MIKFNAAAIMLASASIGFTFVEYFNLLKAITYKLSPGDGRIAAQPPGFLVGITEVKPLVRGIARVNLQI